MQRCLLESHWQRSERVAIWADDDLSVIAAQFVAKHGLSDGMRDKLHALLHAQRNAVLAKKR
jgi:hypothetical protein